MSDWSSKSRPPTGWQSELANCVLEHVLEETNAIEGSEAELALVLANVVELQQAYLKEHVGVEEVVEALHVVLPLR